MWVVGGRRPIPSKMCAQSDPPPSNNADYESFPLITSQVLNRVTDSEKVQRWQTGSRPRAFQRALDRVRTLPLSPPKCGPKSEFCLFE